jgi:hypothetical protein
MFLISCTTSPIAISPPSTPYVVDPACNENLDKITAGKAGPSIIREKIANPCSAYRLVATAAKLGVIWDQYSVTQLQGWIADTKKIVNSGITYNDLNTIATLQIKKFNTKMAGTFLVLSDLVVIVQSPSIMSAQDQAIVSAGLDALLDEAKKLAMLT